METKKFVYEVYCDGEIRCKTSVTVPNNANAYNVAEEKLSKKFDVLKFNHASKTITVSNL